MRDRERMSGTVWLTGITGDPPTTGRNEEPTMDWPLGRSIGWLLDVAGYLVLCETAADGHFVVDCYSQVGRKPTAAVEWNVSATGDHLPHVLAFLCVTCWKAMQPNVRRAYGPRKVAWHVLD